VLCCLINFPSERLIRATLELSHIESRVLPLAPSGVLDHNTFQEALLVAAIGSQMRGRRATDGVAELKN
jgi:hypothetical protein